MNFIRRKTAALSAIALLVICTPVVVSWASDLEVDIRSEALVKGATVTLRDIATFTPESDPRVEALSRIEVASAPSPGNAMTLNRSFLNYRIRAAVSGRGEEIRLEIPESITIRRTANLISGDQLERIFKDHIRTHAPWNPKKIVFEKVDVPESVALPEGKVRWEIQERGSERYLGNVATTINFFVNGRQVRNVPVSGRITVTQWVVKAARRISPGQLLSREDLEVVEEQISSQLQGDVLTAPERAIGKKAVRSIQAGQIIAAQMIEEPPLVKKGNRVLIVAASEMIRVSASGKAVEDGRMGEEVRVMNLSSGKEVQAMVKGPGLVEVTF